MKKETFNLEFITPCFCAGADQAKAEIRPSSIRGQLRWWFRALGGSKKDEALIFGATAGEDNRSSALIVRVSKIQRGPDWRVFPMKMGTPGGYIWYYASVASDKRRWYKQAPQRSGSPGIINNEGHLPPGTAFTLNLVWRRTLDAGLEDQFRLALEAFLRFGAIGMRATRAAGAFICKEFAFADANEIDFEKRLKSSGFEIKRRAETWNDWRDAVFDAEGWLKNKLRKENSAGKNGGNQTPLGSSSPRQTSAVYLRPLKFRDGRFGLVIFEAPHIRVLGRPSRRDPPAIRNLDPSKRPPEVERR